MYVQSNSLGVEEFQRALQATFNFPLRPFVLPFLRAGIPALQREVAALARHAKQVSFIITLSWSTNLHEFSSVWLVQPQQQAIHNLIITKCYSQTNLTQNLQDSDLQKFYCYVYKQVDNK